MGTQTNVWRYRTEMTGRGIDIVGYDVQAADGHIGKVDEATTDTSRSTLVIDTGFWIFGKKRLVPAGVVNRIDDADRTVYLSVTKDQVKEAPDYDAQMHRDENYYTTVSDYYDPYGW